jgi:hypothetical protein
MNHLLVMYDTQNDITFGDAPKSFGKTLMIVRPRNLPD